MKKNFRMKGNMTKIIVIFVLLLFAIGYACREELQDSLVENPAGKAAIERAKTWYEANKPEEITLRSSDGKEKIPAKPVWDYAYSMKDEKYEVVEADLMTQGIISYVNKDCMEKYKETKDRKYKQSYTRMVICTNKKTKETVGFLMTLVPNMEWLEQSNFKPFLKTNYLKRAKDYGGWILFHNLDGSFSNGWVYEQGKITGSIGSMEVEPATLSLRSEGDCYYVDYYLIIETCTDWYTKHEDGDTYNGTTCTDDLIFLYGTWVCPDGTTEGGGYYNGDGGGGGGGSDGSVATPGSVAPNATKLFRNANLTIENWEKLEAMLVKIKSDCLGQGLYDGLASALALRGNTLYFAFSDSASGFNYTNGSISLDMSFESNRLFHEMWHAYQAYQETQSSYAGSTLNQEFESWSAQYLYVSKLPEYKQGSIWYDWYNDSKRGIAVRGFKKFIDPKGNLLQGEAAFWSYLYILSAPYSDFRYGGKYDNHDYNNLLNYPYDSNRTAAYNFRNLTNLSKGC